MNEKTRKKSERDPSIVSVKLGSGLYERMKRNEPMIGGADWKDSIRIVLRKGLDVIEQDAENRPQQKAKFWEEA